MPSIIKIKRSTTAGAPSSLQAGELAYSFADPVNVQGGSRLFIGDGNNITVIGGKYFTDMLDHVPGTLTASSAIVTDSNNKINQLNVDNITLNGNTVSTTNINGDLVLDPNGNGLVNFYGAYTLPNIDGGSGYVLTTDGLGTVSWQPSSSNLRVGDDASTTFDIDLLNQTLYFYGGEGINTALTDGDTVTISAELASDTNLGVASFDATDFTVASGNVTLNSERIEDIAGAMVSGTGATQTNITVAYDDDAGKLTFEIAEASDTVLGVASFDNTNFTVTNGNVETNDITLGTTTLNNGGTSTTLSGLTQLTVDFLRLDGSTLSAIDPNSTDVDITILPQGGGTVFAGDLDLLKVDTNVFYVSNSAGDDNYDGRRVNSSFKTLKHALSQATSGETVFLMPGIYEEQFPLTVPAGVTVKGSGLRSTTVKPTALTNNKDAFLLNNATTVEDLTIRDMFYDSGNDTGYAFRFANGIVISERSPYVQRVTVLNKGSVTTSTDPYGFDQGDAGRGALLDGAVVSRNSLEVAMLFNECTFLVPNSRGVILTNGARTEWLNCFTYFADLAIEGLVGNDGWGNDGKTLLTFSGVSGPGFQVGETVRITSADSSTIIDLTVDSVDGDKIAVDGRVTSLEGADLTPESIEGLGSGTTATSITRYDVTQFGAEMRSISSANVYGNQGAKADGKGVILQLMAHNFAYIGTGADLSNDKSTVSQADEVIEINGGKVYYNSVDQEGNFRVGDLFTVNFETGDVIFANANFDVSSLSGIRFVDGDNETIVNPYLIETGNIVIAGNTISSTTGPITIDPAGNEQINLNSPVQINDVLTVGSYSFPTDDGNAGDVLTTDGNGYVTWQPSSSTLTVEDDSASTTSINLLTETLTVAGGEGIDTTISDNTITISAEDATDTNKGVASFDSTDFTVTLGNVAVNEERIEDIAGAMVSGTGATQTNITVSYDDDAGKLTFEIAEASDTVLGVASFSADDFDVVSGAVSLEDTVVKSITTDTQGSDVVPSSHGISILGGEGIDVTHTGATITIDGELASDSNLGVASFSGTYFTVTNGDVAINDATTTTKGIASFDTNNFTVVSGAVSTKDATIGTSTITLGSTTLSLSGLEQVDVDNLTLDGNEISSTDTDGDISLNPNGAGNVNVNSARITNLTDPIDPQDAATKSYVDAARSGLDVKQSVRVASTQNLSLTGQQTIDGVQTTTGDRVLAKNQTDPVENGIYIADNNGAWSRSDDFDGPTDSSM